MGLIADYLFGTSASGSAPVIPIRNATDLATYFNPQPDAVGSAVQNEEVERFQSSFTAGNHVFNTADLSITAALEGGGSFTTVAKTLIGAVTSGTVLTFSDTTGISDGMMIASSGSSVINTGTSVVSHDSTTVTLGSAVTLPNGANVEFLPVYVCSGVQTGTSISTLTFSSVPAALPVGWFYNNITNGTFGIRRVVSSTSTTVTLDGTVSPSSGNLIFFSPPVTSAQIWSKAGYQPGKNGANYYAFELTCQIPDGAANRGAWPAFWLYSKTSDGFPFDASEIDIFEFFCSLTASSNAYTSNIHGGLYNVTGFQLSVGSGSSKWNSGFYRGGTDYSQAFHKFQLIWTPDKVYRYIDGQLLIVNDFIWSSQDTAQWAIDLACGSWLPAFLGIYFYPKTTAQFPFAIKVQEVKIWQG